MYISLLETPVEVLDLFFHENFKNITSSHVSKWSG